MSVEKGAFTVQMDSESQSTVGMLEGSAQANLVKGSKEKITLNALEVLTVKENEPVPPKPRRVNYQEWRTLSEARDLIVTTAEEIAEQVDLRKEAGSLFQFVFDEGVFFKPNWGYANREFYKETETGEVILRVDYDVYPQDSFSGTYFKLRGFDLSKAKRFTFSLKAEAEKSIPDQFRIEFKDRFSTVRGFAVKPITRDWHFFAFDFNAQQSTPVTEMVFVFENSKIVPMNTNGTVFIKELTIESY